MTATGCRSARLGRRPFCCSWRRRARRQLLVCCLTLTLGLLLTLNNNQARATIRRSGSGFIGAAGRAPALGHQEASKSQASSATSAPTHADPMEPCYLTNNRASESLTISESTPVGSVVGELMVIGDSSQDGNIELSIKMPSGNYHHHHQYKKKKKKQPSGATNKPVASESSQRSGVGTHWQQRQPTTSTSTSTNGYSAAEEPTESAPLARARIGSPANESLPVIGESQSSTEPRSSTSGGGHGLATGDSKMISRDLGQLIDLMPPLTIEQGTKRLILAKKLDRENLDKYISAAGYQTSYAFGGSGSASSSHHQSTSASLTVHVKCQLRERPIGHNRTHPAWSSPDHGALNSSLVSDGGAKLAKYSRSSSILIPIHLIVTDENDNWPTFIGSPYVVDLNESAPVGSLLQGNEMVANDNDQQGPLSTIEYSIVPGSYWSDAFAFLNPLDSRSLVVKSNRLLDFESQPKLVLKVMASDQGDPPNWAITSLYINLIDQDDLGPQFADDKYSAVIRENRPGEIIHLEPRRLIARDGDKTLNGAMVYSFHRKTNHSVHFDLDPDQGRLSLRKKLAEPRDEAAGQQEFCLLIRASQADNPTRWALTVANIRFASSLLGFNQHLIKVNAINATSTNLEVDSNSNRPFRFPQSKYFVEASESAVIGSTLFTVTASHHQLDAQSNDGIRYQLLDNDHGYLNIDAASGQLILNKTLDYEMHREVSVRVLATFEQQTTDNGPRSESYATGAAPYPSLFCDITRVTINVINYNEFAPEFSHEQYNFQLSVSDLIAHFEPPSRESERGSDHQDDDGNDTQVATTANRFIQRFASDTGGGPELIRDDESSVYQEFGYRALQLGQVFCADRDHDDRVSLHLLGSKAAIFHLAQDGKLYLPLTNITSQPTPTSSDSSGPPESSPASQRNMNNQFIMSRLFSASRRSDASQTRANNLMDREYLNYLLSELSNLGRLRLKVLARDDGQPEAKQSTALIVITIISIDNFIIRKGPQSASDQHGASNGSVSADDIPHLSKDGRYETIQDADHQNQSPVVNGQVMMIPSTNGRSFVQIQSDIITNLLSSHNNLQDGSSRPKQTVQDSGNSVLASKSSQPAESLEPAASSPIVSQAVSGPNQLAQNPRSFQPPSLLLVDEDGAKFVDMPAAIAVYNQQVQEAGHQAKQKLMKSQSNYPNEGRFSPNWIWQFWKDQFGLGQDDSGHERRQHQLQANQRSHISNSMYWINLSTALLIHIVLLVIIVTLVSKIFRSSFSGSRSSNRSEDSNCSGSGLWPRRFPKLSFSSQRCDGNPTNPGQVRANCMGSASSSNEFQNVNDTSPFRRSTDVGSRRYAFSHRHHAQAENAAGKPARSGVIHDNSRLDNLTTAANDYSSGESVNLFTNIKNTLGNMLFLAREQRPNDQGISQVTVKPLDSDLELHNDNDIGQQNGSSQPCNNIVQEGASKPAISHQSGNSGSSAPVEATPIKSISTFVGNWQKSRSPMLKQADQAGQSLAKTTVVSINVTVPRPSEINPSTIVTEQLTSKVHKNNSSSSSIVSLVSMSSSLSNTITAAVERRQFSKHTSEQTAISDVSSLDSTSLFNRISTSSNVTNPNEHQRPPASPPEPPPLPPPPSLVQVAGLNRPMQSPSSTRYNTTKSNHATQAESSRSALRNSHRGLQLAPATAKVLPQNPIHVKLKQEASLEQSYCNAEGSLSGAPLRPSQHNSLTGRQSQRNTRRPSLGPSSRPGHQASSTGGRREARQQAAAMDQQRALPPTPPPLPQLKKGSLSGSLSIKTVSPTTSVDRGYESFQSCGSSNQSQPQPGRLAAKLQKQKEQSLGIAQSARSEPQRSCGSLGHHQPVDGAPNRLAMHCENMEDSEDMYYCCNNLVENIDHRPDQIAMDSQDAILDTGLDFSQYHQFNEPPGDLLSQYANHAYWHQDSLPRTSHDNQQVHASDAPHRGSTPGRSNAKSASRLRPTYSGNNAMIGHDMVDFKYLNEHDAPVQPSLGQPDYSLSEAGVGHRLVKKSGVQYRNSRIQRRSASSQAHVNNGGCKKQLTWSDKIEITS